MQPGRAAGGVRALRGFQGNVSVLSVRVVSCPAPVETKRRALPRREVHFLQEGLEAGVGTEGVEDEEVVNKYQHWLSLVGGLLLPRDSLIVVAETHHYLST